MFSIVPISPGRKVLSIRGKYSRIRRFVVIKIPTGLIKKATTSGGWAFRNAIIASGVLPTLVWGVERHRLPVFVVIKIGRMANSYSSSNKLLLLVQVKFA